MSPAEWEILATSFSVASRALAWSLPFAIAMAFFLSRPGTPGRIILDGLTHLPVILPPVLVAFSTSRPVSASPNPWASAAVTVSIIRSLSARSVSK